MVDRILACPKARGYMLAPVVRSRKGEYRKELAEFLKKGYQRVKVDGAFYRIAEVPALDKKFTHDIDVVVDDLVVRPDIATRLADFAGAGAQARRRARHRGARRRRSDQAARRPSKQRNETAKAAW